MKTYLNLLTVSLAVTALFAGGVVGYLVLHKHETANVHAAAAESVPQECYVATCVWTAGPNHSASGVSTCVSGFEPQVFKLNMPAKSYTFCACCPAAATAAASAEPAALTKGK